MHSLLALLLITTLIAILLCVTGALLVWRTMRRLCGNVRVRIAAALTNAPLPALSRPTAGQAYTGSSLGFQARADLRSAVTVGPLLSARASLPGRKRAVSLVRRDLHRDVSATARVLHTARNAGRPLHDLESSVAMLTEHARELQLELQVIAAEPDNEVRAQMLSPRVVRASLIRQGCANVRAAVMSEGTAYNEATLRQIVHDTNDAVIAIDLRTRAYRELSRP